MQQIIPMMSYEDGLSAIDWLTKAFGFTENKAMRFTEDGRLTHAELCLGESIIMLATPTAEYESNNTHRKHCRQMNQWLQTPYIVDGLLVYIEDIDAHYAKAKQYGADILSGIENGFPGRRYRCADIEGHRWMFMQKEKEL